MEQLTGWIENSSNQVKPISTFDFAAKLIERATELNYSNTKDIQKRYADLITSFNVLEIVALSRNNEDELNSSKKAVYTCYNELINELNNYLNCHEDNETRFHLRELILKFGQYRR